MEPIECKDVGKQLNLMKSVIMDHWENNVRGSITQSEQEHSMVVRNHVHEILENLIQYLTEGYLDEVELGKAHGNQRAVLTNFSVQDILKEYSLLRELLITYLYPIGEVDCAKLVHKYLDIVAKNSVTEFLRETDFDRIRTDGNGSEIKELEHDLEQSLREDNNNSIDSGLSHQPH